MTTIPTALESAFASYLRACGDPVEGGLWRFATRDGQGVQIDVREGHSGEGIHPETGLIICRCEQNAVEQEIIGINGWRAVVVVELLYPHDSHEYDPNAVGAFEFVASEISESLTHEDALTRLNQAANGIEILGVREGIAMQASIEGSRSWTWTISLLVSQTQKRQIDL